MSCNTCQAKFSFFTKEHGCPKCGFLYCSRCLKYKCNLPSAGNTKICGRCYNKLNSSQQGSPETPDLDGLDELAPVDVDMKVQNLENPSKKPIIVYKHTKYWDQLKSGLEPADHEIVDRLMKLKGEDPSVSPPSVEELMRRLALLRDEDPEGVNKTVNIHQTDTRTDQQKANDLMQRYLARLQLSVDNDPSSEIEQKLRLLRGEVKENHPAKWEQNDDNYDEDKVAKKLIAEASCEAALEKEYKNEDDWSEGECEDMESSSDEQDKPHCVMCDRTTNLSKCLGCTGDLYCSRCFAENHDELENHKLVPFHTESRVSPD